MDREQITFTGAQETMLATLYARALDDRSANPILHDHAAADAVQRIDYNFCRTGMIPTFAAAVALRARHLDTWTAQFLAEQPQATVLHLACGLDTRVDRIDPPPSVRWIDVDYPEVVELRRRLLPDRGAGYRLVSSSVVDDAWLDTVPADRPTLVVFEGLSMYLRKSDGRRLVERITARFPSGQLLFDCLSTPGVWGLALVPLIRKAGATVNWSIDDPRELESWHDGLTCLDAVRYGDLPELDKLPVLSRLGAFTLAQIPLLRDVSRILRYRF